MQITFASSMTISNFWSFAPSRPLRSVMRNRSFDTFCKLQNRLRQVERAVLRLVQRLAKRDSVANGASVTNADEKRARSASLAENGNATTFSNHDSANSSDSASARAVRHCPALLTKVVSAANIPKQASV